jgi:hypothetical protein
MSAETSGRPFDAAALERQYPRLTEQARSVVSARPFEGAARVDLKQS